MCAQVWCCFLMYVFLPLFPVPLSTSLSLRGRRGNEIEEKTGTMRTRRMRSMRFHLGRSGDSYRLDLIRLRLGTQNLTHSEPNSRISLPLPFTASSLHPWDQGKRSFPPPTYPPTRPIYPVPGAVKNCGCVCQTTS